MVTMDMITVENIIQEAIASKSQVINLSHRNITVLSNNVTQLIHVNRLLLNDNQILMPPTEITDLIQLQELVLNNPG
jgi:Leucine-rich repeat (LRR) protein